MEFNDLAPPAPCPGRGDLRCARVAWEDPGSTRQANFRLGWGEKPLKQEKCSGVRGQSCSPLRAPSA